MYLVHLPFTFKFDEKTSAAATHEDGSYILDFDTDPVSVWKVCVCLRSTDLKCHVTL